MSVKAEVSRVIWHDADPTGALFGLLASSEFRINELSTGV